jgi:hypothetical protein
MCRTLRHRPAPTERHGKWNHNRPGRDHVGHHTVDPSTTPDQTNKQFSSNRRHRVASQDVRQKSELSKSWCWGRRLAWRCTSPQPQLASRRTRSRCEACSNERQVHHERFAPLARLVKAGSTSRRARKAKQLSAQAAEMPDQPARGVPRAGGHRPQRCPRGERVAVNPFWAGHHMVQTREGGECV